MIDRTKVELSEYEDRLLDTIESNINFFNQGKFRTNQLYVKLYVDNGNRANLYKGQMKICTDMTLDQLFWAVVGISNYNRKGY